LSYTVEQIAYLARHFLLLPRARLLVDLSSGKKCLQARNSRNARFVANGEGPAFGSACENDPSSEHARRRESDLTMNAWGVRHRADDRFPNGMSHPFDLDEVVLRSFSDWCRRVPRQT